MEIEEKYKAIKDIVESELTCSAHNLDHVYRVYKLCLLISEYEEAVDLDVLIPAALLHDIARVKESADKTGETDHAVLGSEMAVNILRELNYNEDKIEQIRKCIISHRFRTGNRPETIEAKILFDADKLDAIGAVGIARTFMLSGQFGQKLSMNIETNQVLEDNSVENGRLKDPSKHTVFMEYEIKFKKIPEKLYTKKAKEIGFKRLEYMAEFFKKLNLEMNGME